MDLVTKVLLQSNGALELAVAIAAAKLGRVLRALQVIIEPLDSTEYLVAISAVAVPFGPLMPCQEFLFGQGGVTLRTLVPVSVINVLFEAAEASG